MNVQPEFAELFKLPPAERLQLVEPLWDSPTPREAGLPVADGVKTELRERKKRFSANPESGMTWDDVVLSLDEG